MKILVTVIICTYNRCELLRACLKALLCEMSEKHEAELLVVDNNSSDNTESVVREFQQVLPQLRYVREEKQGLSYARNRGYAEARGHWLAYLDDDARVLVGYFERLTSLVNTTEFDCVGGVFSPWYRDGKRGWFLDRYASNRHSSDHYGELGGRVLAAGGNCLFRKEALRSIGGFLPQLGMAGGNLGYGEETRAQAEMRRHGYRIGFDPAWCVEHFTPLEKQTLGWIWRSAYATGRDSWTAYGEIPSLIHMLNLSRKLFTRPLLSLFNLLSRHSERHSWQNHVVAILQPVGLTLGQLSSGIKIYKYGR